MLLTAAEPVRSAFEEIKHLGILHSPWVQRELAAIALEYLLDDFFWESLDCSEIVQSAPRCAHCLNELEELSAYCVNCYEALESDLEEELGMAHDEKRFAGVTA